MRAVPCLVMLASPAAATTISARVRWQPSPTTTVTGYHVYARSVTGVYGAPLDAGKPTVASDGSMSYVVAGLDSVAGSAFEVAAYLSSGLESLRSNEVVLPGTGGTSTTTTTVRTTTTTLGGTATTTTSTLAPPPTTGTTIPGLGTCGSPTLVPAAGGIFTGSTSGGSTLAGSCQSTSNLSPERVFQWTPAVSGTATIDTCNAIQTTFDTVLYVRSGSCGASDLTCNDDTTGCPESQDGTSPHRGSRITPTVTAGQTYFIVVDGYNGASGNFALTITPPANVTGAGTCVAPTVLPAAGGTFTGTTSGTSAVAGACSSNTATAPETVFAWTPSVSGTATIQTCSASQTTFDTVVYMRLNTCAGSEIACNDDTLGCGDTLDASNPHQGSTIKPTVTAGQTYYIVVDGWGSLSNGGFALTVTPPGAPTVVTNVTGGPGTPVGDCDTAGDCPTPATCEQTSCVDHVCVKQPIECGDPGPCADATCDPATGCRTAPRSNGTACTGDDPCVAGRCEDGACAVPQTARAVEGDHQLRVRRFAARPVGRSWDVVAAGAFAEPVPVDPTRTGMVLEVATSTGRVLDRATLSPGAFVRRPHGFRFVPHLNASDTGVRRLALRIAHGRVAFRAELLASDLGMSATTPDLRWVVRLGDLCLRDLTMGCAREGTEVRCR